MSEMIVEDLHHLQVGVLLHTVGAGRWEACRREEPTFSSAQFCSGSYQTKGAS